MRRAVTLEAFRETFSAVPVPVSIVTASRYGEPHGTTVSSFCSLSADPPLLLVALDEVSNTLEIVLETRRFGVNVLAVGQEDVARAAARKGPGKFDAIGWRDEGGLPRIDGAAGWLACEMEDELPGGDHVIVVGLVTACESSAAKPLLYHRRTFSELTEVFTD